MSEQDKIQLFEDQPIRTAWDPDQEEWYFSVVDVVGVLTGQATQRGASNYWAKLKERLKAEGVLTTGEVQSIRHLVWINWNTSTFVKRPGQCSPWVVQCSYEYQGQTYIVRSGLFWAKPSFRHQQPAIYFDPHHPTRAYVDMVAIQREA